MMILLLRFLLLLQALSQNGELLQMMMAMHRDRSAGNESEAELTVPPSQHEVSCRVN